MIEKLRTIVKEYLSSDIDALNDETLLTELPDWDSMTHMMMIVKLEEEFNFRFTGEEIAEMRTIGNLKNRVESKLK